MGVDDLYASHLAAPTADTLNALLAAVSVLANQMASWAIRTPDAEDVAAVAVASIWQALDRHDERVPLSAWCRVIIRRRIADHLRQRYTQPQLVAASETHRDDVTRLTYLTEPPSLHKLTAGQRELLQRFAANPDYRSLAAELGIKVPRLRRRLQRIKQKICGGDSLTPSTPT